MTAGLAQRIAQYQDMCQNMVAGKGQNHKSLPKKREGKGKCTKRAHRTDGGEAISKTLRKREKRLQARKRGHMETVNRIDSSSGGNSRGYHIPGSLR